MEFSDITNHQVNLINMVLNDLGAPNIFENPDFVVDMDSLGFHHIVLSFVKKNKKSVPLVFYLEGDGIRLDVCGISESFEWSNDSIFAAGDSVADFFKKLLTSYVLVESCGSAGTKSRMYLFDKEGALIAKFALRGWIQAFSGWDCEKILFSPIY